MQNLANVTADAKKVAHRPARAHGTAQRDMPVGVRMTSAQHAQLVALAAAEDRSISSMVRKLLETGMAVYAARRAGWQVAIPQPAEPEPRQ